MTDLLGSILELVVKVEVPSPSGEFESLFDLLGKQMDALSGYGTDIKESFKHIFGPDGFTLADLDLDKIQRILYSLVLNLAKRATEMTRNVVTHLINSVAGLVDLMRRILFTTIRFPFIEDLRPADRQAGGHRRTADRHRAVRAVGARHHHLQTVHG